MRKNIDKLRPQVFKRDGRQCRYCGETKGPFHLDHVYPVSKGGIDSVKNLVVACAPCNLQKHAKVGIWPYPIGYFNDQEEWSAKLSIVTNHLNRIVYRLIIILALLLYATMVIFFIGELFFGGNSFLIDAITIVLSSAVLFGSLALWGSTR